MIKWGCALIACNVIDWAMTVVVLSNGGQELNPVMNYVIMTYGFAGLGAYKIAVATGCAAACIKFNMAAVLRLTTIAFVGIAIFMAAQAWMSVGI